MEGFTMNTNFDFYNPTHILFGSGKLDELGNQPMPGKKALLLISSGKSAKVSGALERTQAQLEKAGVRRGFSNSRTCEIGLSVNAGIPYHSIVYLVDECTTKK